MMKEEITYHKKDTVAPPKTALLATQYTRHTMLTVFAFSGFAFGIAGPIILFEAVQLQSPYISRLPLGIYTIFFMPIVSLFLGISVLLNPFTTKTLKISVYVGFATAILTILGLLFLPGI